MCQHQNLNGLMINPFTAEDTPDKQARTAWWKAATLALSSTTSLLTNSRSQRPQFPPVHTPEASSYASSMLEQLQSRDLLELPASSDA